MIFVVLFVVVVVVALVVSNITCHGVWGGAQCSNLGSQVDMYAIVKETLYLAG